MASLHWSDKLNPTVEIMSIQQSKIRECINSINVEIADTHRKCMNITDLLHQLEQLCQLHFMYEEQLLEEVNYPSIAEQKKLHELFLKAIEPFKLEHDQCHTPAYINDFNKLRLDFVANMTNETMLLCDYIIKNYRGDTAASQ